MKIANKISLSFLIIATMLAGIAMPAFYNSSRANIRKSIYNSLVATAVSRTAHIETFLEMGKGTTNQLSKSIVIEELLLSNKKDKDYSQKFNKVIKRLKNTARVQDYFYDLFVLNKEGIITASSDESDIGKDKSKDAYFLGAKKAAFIKDAYISTKKQFKTIVFSAPILGENDTFLGVLVARVFMRAIDEITTNRAGLGETGEIYLINKDGYVITPSRFKGDTFLKLKVDTENSRKCYQDIKEFGEKNHPHIPLIFRDYRGVEVLGIHDHIHEMQWCLLSEIDVEEVLAPLARIRNLFVIVLLIIPIMTWLISLFVSRRIASPIHKLHTGTEIIGNGNLDYKVGTDAKDEVGQLSRAFDMMTDNLKFTTTSIDNLNKEIAERKKAEEKLKHAAKEWKNTFDSISDLIFIQDKEHTILKVNKAFADALKMKPSDIVGKKCYELLHKSNNPYPGCPFEETKKDKKTHTKEINDLNIGIPLLISTSPIFSEKGELIGSVHIAKDITERKKVEEKTKEAMEIKSQFISMVSHELRTPMTAIKEGIAIVLDGSAGNINDEQKEFLDTAKRNVNRLARLINAVLDFQKLQAGKMPFEMKENDMNDVVNEVSKEMNLLLEKKELKFNLNLDKNLPKAVFDKDRIMQVLINLMNNALKFTEKGSISIATQKKDKTIKISVADTGFGIKKEDIEKLFHMFEQLEKSGDRKTGGTGLGLAISKEIIEKHNGKIWAESKPGKGTSFCFTLPVVTRRK